MKLLRYSCAALMLASLASIARADEDAEKPADKPPAAERESRPGREEMHKRMLERFDEDKDGKLSDEEREKVREFRREQFGERGGLGPREGRGPGARGPEGRGPDGPGPGGPPEGRRWEGRGPGGPEGRGPGGPGGPGRGPGGPEGRGFRPMGPPPPPAELFKEFDADKNDQLSVEEFEKLMGHLRDRMPGPPRGFRGPGGPGGPGPEGRPHRGDSEGRPDRRRHHPPRDKAVEESTEKSEKAEEKAPAEDEKAVADGADEKTA